MTSIFVPEPVISLAIKPEDKKASDRMAKALNRFTKEDPTFRTHVDPESHETIIQGMGELHLDVYVERMKREYNAEVETGKPQVAYREAITQAVEFDYTHKKQTGGAGQYGRVIGSISSPQPRAPYEFVNEVKGGASRGNSSPPATRASGPAMRKGELIGFPDHRRPGRPERRRSPTTSTPPTSPSRWRPSAPSARSTARPSPRSSSRS